MVKKKIGLSLGLLVFVPAMHADYGMQAFSKIALCAVGGAAAWRAGEILDKNAVEPIPTVLRLVGAAVTVTEVVSHIDAKNLATEMFNFIPTEAVNVGIALGALWGGRILLQKAFGVKEDTVFKGYGNITLGVGAIVGASWALNYYRS